MSVASSHTTVEAFSAPEYPNPSVEPARARDAMTRRGSVFDEARSLTGFFADQTVQVRALAKQMTVRAATRRIERRALRTCL